MSKSYVGEATSVRAQDIIEVLGNFGVNIPICEVPVGKTGKVDVRHLKAYSAGLKIKQTTRIIDPDQGFSRPGHNFTGLTPSEVFEFVKAIDPLDEMPVDGCGDNPIVVNTDIHELVRQVGRAWAHFHFTGELWSTMPEHDGEAIPAHHVMLRREGEGDTRQVRVMVTAKANAYVSELEIAKGTGKWFWHPIQKRVRSKVWKRDVNAVPLTKYHFLAQMVKQEEGTSSKTGIKLQGTLWIKAFKEGLLSETWKLSGRHFLELKRGVRQFGQVS